MCGTGDPRMFERLGNSVMSETLKKAFFDICLDLVPYTYSISFEGTVGITIDNNHILFLHFSDAANRSADDDAVGPAVQSSPQHAAKNSMCSRRSFSNKLDKISTPLARLKGSSDCADGSMKHSLLLCNVNLIQSACSSEDVPVQSGQPERQAVVEAGLELSMEKSTSARRKGRPAKFPNDGVTLFRSSSSNQVSNVCPVTADEETAVSPLAVQSYDASIELDDSEVLDFSARSKMELFKSSMRDVSMATNENSKYSRLQTGLDDYETESAQMKESVRNRRDRTLLRQLLLNNTKTNQATPVKRRLSGSDNYFGKKTCMEASLCVDETSEIESFGVLPQEPDAHMVGVALRTTPSLRSSVSKKTEVRSTDDSGGERRANPDSILCRLLTSGVNMYDTTEVERLRQVSANKLKVARDQDVSGTVRRNTATTDELGSALVDLMLTNIKTERESRLRTDELVANMLVEPNDNTLHFQSNVQCITSNSPLGQLPQSGLGPLRSLPDAAVTAPPQIQTNCDIEDRRLAIVKEEHDSVDVHRTLHTSAADYAQTKENLYHARFTKSLDFGK